jgi:uncharacterized protein YjbI with pentapeptide repeats
MRNSYHTQNQQRREVRSHPTNMEVSYLLKCYEAGYRTFRGIDLRRANLNGVTLIGVDLTGANLSGAKLTQANLNWSNLSQANLNMADLSAAHIFGVRIEGVELTDVNLPDVMRQSLCMNTSEQRVEHRQQTQAMLSCPLG